MSMMIARVLLWLSASAPLLAAVAPWGLYWVGLNAIDSMPTPPTRLEAAEEQAAVWHGVRGRGVPQVRSLSPYSYLYLVASAAPQDPSALAAWDVAAAHLLAHRRSKGMLWWHLSGAALTIWITRNWSTDQILSQVSLTRRKATAKQSLEPARLSEPPPEAQPQQSPASPTRPGKADE